MRGLRNERPTLTPVTGWRKSLTIVSTMQICRSLSLLLAATLMPDFSYTRREKRVLLVPRVGDLQAVPFGLSPFLNKLRRFHKSSLFLGACFVFPLEAMFSIPFVFYQQYSWGSFYKKTQPLQLNRSCKVQMIYASLARMHQNVIEGQG